jgi:hypothetical protein
VLINELVNVCKQFLLPNDGSVVIEESYIPYIPEQWNKILVLAESQNLSASNCQYVKTLLSMSQEGRIRRLGASPDYVGVYPWDDGSIKLAVEAAFQVDSSRVAVSNAVLWSQRGKNEENKNPDIDLQGRSSKIWSELLCILKPEKIICCGKIAQSVIAKTNWEGEVINLRLPAKTAMSRVSGMFNEADLLKRYPEVEKVLNQNPSLIRDGFQRNKIFYACHAISLQTQI